MGEIIIKVPGDIKEVIEVNSSREDARKTLEEVEKKLNKLKASQIALSLIGKVDDGRNYKEIKEEFYKNAY